MRPLWPLLGLMVILRSCEGPQMALAQGVQQMPYTFLAQPLNGEPTNGSPRAVFLFDTSAITAVYPTVGTLSTSGTNGIDLYMDQEAMLVQSVFNGGAMVVRGVNGTRVTAHGALAKVWVATRGWYWPRNPFGACNPFSLTVSPAISIPSGQAFLCEGQGTWATSPFSWNSAQFSWSKPVQSIWQQTTIENGTWEIATVPWQNESYQWRQLWNGIPANQ